MYPYGLGCRTTNCAGLSGAGEGPGDPWYAGPAPDQGTSWLEDPWRFGADEGAGGTETEPVSDVEKQPVPTSPAIGLAGGNTTWGLIGALAGFAFGRGKKKVVTAVLGGAIGYFAGNRFAA